MTGASVLLNLIMWSFLAIERCLSDSVSTQTSLFLARQPAGCKLSHYFLITASQMPFRLKITQMTLCVAFTKGKASCIIRLQPQLSKFILYTKCS